MGDDWNVHLMDSLKALVAKKRKEKEEEFEGKRFVKRGEIEDKRLKRLRDAEERELALKVLILCDRDLSN